MCYIDYNGYRELKTSKKDGNMNILKFESKELREFKTQLKTNSPEVLDSVKNHYLDKTNRLAQILRSKREKVLGELTYFQFTKYQAFHKYADSLSPAQLDTITTRIKTRRLIQDCKEISDRINNCYDLLDCTRNEIENRVA